MEHSSSEDLEHFPFWGNMFLGSRNGWKYEMARRKRLDLAEGKRVGFFAARHVCGWVGAFDSV